MGFIFLPIVLVPACHTTPNPYRPVDIGYNGWVVLGISVVCRTSATLIILAINVV